MLIFLRNSKSWYHEPGYKSNYILKIYVYKELRKAL